LRWPGVPSFPSLPYVVGDAKLGCGDEYRLPFVALDRDIEDLGGGGSIPLLLIIATGCGLRRIELSSTVALYAAYDGL